MWNKLVYRSNSISIFHICFLQKLIYISIRLSCILIAGVLLRNLSLIAIDLKQCKNNAPTKGRKKQQKAKDDVMSNLWDEFDKEKNICKFLRDAGTLYIENSKAISDCLRSTELNIVHYQLFFNANYISKRISFMSLHLQKKKWKSFLISCTVT